MSGRADTLKAASTSTPARGGWHWAPWACEFLGTAILLISGLSAVFLNFGPSSPVARHLPSMSARLLLTGGGACARRRRCTYKLVWTQTVSRQKWLAVKLSVIGAAAALGGLALGVMISAWLSVFRGTTFPGVYPDRSFFELRGIVPSGWWASRS